MERAKLRITLESEEFKASGEINRMIKKEKTLRLLLILLLTNLFFYPLQFLSKPQVL